MMLISGRNQKTPLPERAFLGGLSGEGLTVGGRGRTEG